MEKPCVLIVEDDGSIRRGLADALRFAGYATLEAEDGNRGLELAVGTDCDLVLLDLVLPGRDGLDILREVRSARPTLPVVILTARGAEAERVRGLSLGADDYVVKPFSIKELLARVEAVLRRTPERPSPVTSAAIPGGLIDLSRCEVRFQDGRRSELSEREVELLQYLMANSGRAISREELLSRVWRVTRRRAATRTVDMQVARLREKLGDDSSQPRILLTVRGKGYMFAAGGESP